MHRGCHISRRVCERWDHRRRGSATLVRRSSRSFERARLSALPLSNSPSQCHSEQEDHSHSRMIFVVEESAVRARVFLRWVCPRVSTSHLGGSSFGMKVGNELCIAKKH